MTISSNEAERLNNSDPTNQRSNLGTELLATPSIIRFPIAADATGALTITVPVSMVICDVWVECTTASGSGTATLRSATTAITDAMIMAVDKVIVRAGTLDNTVTSITAATSLNVITNGAADRGIVSILGYAT